MRRLAIDFAAPSWGRALRRTPPLFWLLGVAGAALCAGALFFDNAETVHQATLRAKVDALQSRLAARHARLAARPVQALPEGQVVAVNAIVTQLNQPWSAVLDALESASGQSVALLEIHTDAKAGLLRGTAEAANSRAMLAYVERLKQQSVVEGASLSKHEINTQDASDPIRFEFEVRWRGPRP